jgi:phenylacetate-CoA ligase
LDEQENEALAHLQDVWSKQASTPQWKIRFERIDSLVAVDSLIDSLFEAGLRQILDYARKTVEFYHSNDELDLGDPLIAMFRRFPVINSSVIRRNPSEFVAKGSIVSGLEVRMTSGSTGPPMFHIQSFDSEFVFSSALRGRIERRHGIGSYAEVLDLSPRLIRADGAHLEPVLSVDYTGGERRIWKLQRLDNRSSASREEYERFGRRGYDIVFGAPSRIQEYIAWCIEHAWQPRPRLVICTYEELSQTATTTLESFFRAPIVNLYGTTETGFLASSCNARQFDVEMDLAVVEILRADGDEAVEEGELGRVVVTSLKSWAMPIIRYDTGDLARLGRQSEFGPGIARTLLEIDGRRGTTFIAADGLRIGAGRVLQPLKSAGVNSRCASG